MFIRIVFLRGISAGSLIRYGRPLHSPHAPFPLYFAQKYSSDSKRLIVMAKKSLCYSNMQIGSATTIPTGVPRALEQPEFQIARPPNFDYATTSHASMCPTTVMHQRLTNAYCPMPFMSLIRT